MLFISSIQLGSLIVVLWSYTPKTRTVLGERSFSIAIYWNSFTISTRSAESITAFDLTFQTVNHCRLYPCLSGLAFWMLSYIKETVDYLVYVSFSSRNVDVLQHKCGYTLLQSYTRESLVIYKNCESSLDPATEIARPPRSILVSHILPTLCSLLSSMFEFNSLQ